MICPNPGTPDSDLPGVLNPAGKPIHTVSDEDKKKVPEVHELFFDTGRPADEVKQRVKVGDMVVLQAPYAGVGNCVVSQCLDNRVARWIAIRAIEQLEENAVKHACEVACVFTVQEEVGLRGARTSAYALKPDIGIGLDTTLCGDTPGTREDVSVTKQRRGWASPAWTPPRSTITS